MATITRVKQWTFGAAGHYALADDATIAASVLSMTAPKLELPWATHWDNEPSYDGSGNAVLAQNVTYKAHTGGADITMLDGELRMQVVLGAAATWFVTLRGGQTNPILAVVDSGGLELESSGADAEHQKYLDGVYREWVVEAIDGVASVDVVAEHKHEMSGLTDSAAAGTVTLKNTAATGQIVLGGGSDGTEDQPYLAYRRTGKCELKVTDQLTIPYGTTALGRLTLVADRKGGGTEPLLLPLKYKIDTGFWTVLPADGDLSGVSFTAGTSTIRWRIDGMDNAADCRYVPSVYAVLLTYEQTTASWTEGEQLKDVLTNIKAALNADGTLMAYEGWSGAQVGWAEVMDLQLYHRCGCIVEWKETPEEHRGQQRVAGALTNMIDETHTVVVKACMRPDRPSLEDMLTGADQLFDFTEDVLSVLRAETLGGTVHSVTVGGRTPSIEYFEANEAEDEPGDALLVVEIEVEVHGKPFEAVRP